MAFLQSQLQFRLSAELRKQIAQIHASPWRGVLEESGTGSWGQMLLQTVSGASQTLTSAHTHYGRQAQTVRYGPQERALARETVEHWARLNLAAPKTDASQSFSLALSGAVATSVPSPSGLVGDQHVWLALALGDGRGWTLHLRLLQSERLAQQASLGLLVVQLLALLVQDEVLNLSALPTDLQEAFEIDVWRDWRLTAAQQLESAVALLQSGWTPLLLFEPQQGVLQPRRYLEVLRGRRLLLHKGSFNPPTRAHLTMVDKVLERADADYLPVLEISLQNADKGAAGHENLLHRLAMLGHQPWSVALTRTPALYQTRELFSERAQTQQVDFVCGEDLYRRVFLDKYYRDLEGGIAAGLTRLFEGGTHLWVCGRETDLDFPAAAQKWAESYCGRMTWIPLALPVASSAIRTTIAAGQTDWQAQVSPEVRAYIQQKGLYRT